MMITPQLLLTMSLPSDTVTLSGIILKIKHLAKQLD